MRPLSDYWSVYQAQDLQDHLELLVREWKDVLKNFSRGDDHISWDTSAKVLFELFQICDANGDQRLEWNGGELRHFVRRAYSQHGLPGPLFSEQVWLAMYRDHDSRVVPRFDLVKSVRFLVHVSEVLHVMATARGLPVQVAPDVFVMCRHEEQRYDTHPVPSDEEMSEAKTRAEEWRRLDADARRLAEEESAVVRRRHDEVQQRLAIDLLARQEEEAWRIREARRAADKKRELEERLRDRLAEEARLADEARRQAVTEARMAQAARQQAESTSKLEKERLRHEEDLRRIEDEQRGASDRRRWAEEEARKSGTQRAEDARQWREVARQHADCERSQKSSAAATDDLRKKAESKAIEADESRRQKEMEAIHMMEARQGAEAKWRRAKEDRCRVEVEKADADAAARKAEEERRLAEEERKRAQNETFAQKRELEVMRRQHEEKHRKDDERRKHKEICLRLEGCKKVWVKARSVITVEHAWHECYAEHLEQILSLLEEWDCPYLQGTMSTVFFDVDWRKNGFLEWNNSEVREFIGLIFTRAGLPAPVLEERNWYRLYRQFDVDGSFKLDFKEAGSFAKLLHEEVVKRAPVPATKKPASGEKLSDQLSNWESTTVQAMLEKHFREVDRDHDSFLSWNESEVRSFIRKIFDVMGLPIPKLPEQVWYQLYREVDAHGNFRMSLPEASAFVRHLCKRIIDFFPHMRGAYGISSFSPMSSPKSAPALPATPASSPLLGLNSQFCSPRYPQSGPL